MKQRRSNLFQETRYTIAAIQNAIDVVGFDCKSRQSCKRVIEYLLKNKKRSGKELNKLKSRVERRLIKHFGYIRPPRAGERVDDRRECDKYNDSDINLSQPYLLPGTV